MSEILTKVSECCRSIGDILFTLCVIVLLFWLVGKLICFIYNLFSWPKSKIAYEFGRQYELIRDTLDLIDNDIKTAKCNNNQDKKRIQLEGEILRITHLLSSCTDLNNMSDKEKSKLLIRLHLQIKDFFDQMNKESVTNSDIYRINAKGIEMLCSDIKNMINEPSESCLTKLKKKISNIFCNKHKNSDIENIKKEITQLADNINDAITKKTQANDNGQAQQ